MSGRPVIERTRTPDGVLVVVFHDTWYEHILGRAGHAELAPYLSAVLQTVAVPDHRVLDRWPKRERFFKREVGPSLWLMVVVDYEREPARIVTALGHGHGRSPRGWTH